MGNLLREVLKTLCGFNQWCYAVFWKLGCQNPKLLIWEECYCELNPSSVPQPNCGPEKSELLFGEHKGFCGSDSHFLNPEFQARDKVQMLVDKMMLNNQVCVVGEGIVGRAAFTGKHDWILTNMYTGDLCPPEVLNELHHQFSAGVQTVAVIPAFPYGVVQVGSLLSITENMGFVNNVRSLILQLGCNPGALLSGYHSTKDSIERIGVLISDGAPISTHMINSTTLCTEGSSQQIISAQASNFLGQTSHSRPGQSSTVMAYSMPHVDNLVAKSFEGHSEVKSSSLMKSGSAFRNPLENVLETELLPSNFDAWLSQHATSNNSMAGVKYQPVTGQSITGNSFPKSLMLSDAIHDCISNNRDASQSLPLPQTNKVLLSDFHGGSLTSSTDLPNKLDGHMKLSSIPSSNINPKKLVASYLEDIGPQSVVTSMAEEFLSSTLVPQVSSNEMLSDCNSMSSGMKPITGELVDVKEELDNDLFQVFNISSTQLEESLSLVENISGTGLDCLKHASGNQHPPSGDDLYDILGVDLKSKLIYGAWNNSFSDGPHSNTQNLSKDALTVMNMQDASCDIYSIKERTAGNSIFSAMDNDHLLDAVVSRAQSAANQSSDDNVSCRTTLTKMSTSVPSDSCNRGRLDVPNQPNRGSFDLQKFLDKAGTTASSSIRSDYVKGDKGASSQSTSICGSQLSSWVEQAHNMRPDCSISTAFSKKSEELSKPNRKRLKPGENPRPRPKDRQMIQDRVKELREIVPNGTKCSIDALLERTIKHMLFLQSVIKHADKLKQTGESKIISKEGGLLLKDNFDGGATWAFEVGSQSTVCPIIVEDLNPPRQMLVEMLCEECGIFLEIADLIKGLGLTILKGVMEARNDKIWARFAVEANRDVTRMEIFVSLVRILEQTMKGSTSSANILENNNMMVHQAFSQAPSIAATARPSSLQ